MKIKTIFFTLILCTLYACPYRQSEADNKPIESSKNRNETYDFKDDTVIIEKNDNYSKRMITIDRIKGELLGKKICKIYNTKTIKKKKCVSITQSDAIKQMGIINSNFYNNFIIYTVAFQYVDNEKVANLQLKMYYKEKAQSNYLQKIECERID